MKRFLSTWLVWIVVAVFALALLLGLPPLTGQAEQAARTDLTALTNAAFNRIALAQKNLEGMRAASNENILSKDRAVARFLAHDDTLLETDALVVLCEMLHLYEIDVTGSDGVVIATSQPANMGRNLLEDTSISWTKAVFDDPTVEQAEPDVDDETVLIGAVPRTDIEGIVLVRGRDESVATAKAAADPHEVLRQMSFIQDAMEVVEDGEKEGVSIIDGLFTVRTTRDGVTIAASRSLSSVYVLRNAIALVLSIFMVVCVVASVVIQSLIPKRRRRRVHPAETDMQTDSQTTEDEILLRQALLPVSAPEPVPEQAAKRVPVKTEQKKRRRSGAAAPENAPIPEDAQQTQTDEETVTPAVETHENIRPETPEQEGKPEQEGMNEKSESTTSAKHRKGAKKTKQRSQSDNINEEEQDAGGFDKIF
ncbi:MAG: hypothetical protein RR475_10185 [Clostridia bacterium]